jgi:hypothetical protein
MYKCDLRTSSTVVLDIPMSASSRSSSSRSCWYWHRRSHASAIPASHASGVFHLLRSGKESEGASVVCVGWDVVLPQDMFHLRKGAKQLLAAEAYRAVVNGPSKLCIIRTCGAQAIVSKHQSMKSPCGLPRFTMNDAERRWRLCECQIHHSTRPARILAGIASGAVVVAYFDVRVGISWSMCRMMASRVPA